MRKRVIIVGATGSIGRQTLDVVAAHPDLFEVVGLSAHRSVEDLRLAASKYPKAELCLSADETTGSGFRFTGQEGIQHMIEALRPDLVVNGAAGSGGLKPSLAALSAGADLALANKESVVMAWSLLSRTAREKKARILPVDSEHAALFQLCEKIGRDSIEELIITASGGAFRDLPLSKLASVTPEQAATHPNWSMGRKITIDSATMANKGLEVIEASRLFGFPADRIKVLIHPQSMVHSLVRSKEGSLFAQISQPDMRVPIQNALTWPDYQSCPFGRLDLAGHNLEFRAIEAERYPLLDLAYRALTSGEGHTVVFNAADEMAVEAFEARRIGYLDIAAVVQACLEADWPSRLGDLESIFKVDAGAREKARTVIRELEC